MEFLTVYLLVAPFLCLIGAALLQCIAEKVKTALAKKQKPLVNIRVMLKNLLIATTKHAK